MSKGDWARPMDKAKFDEGYEAVFGKRPLNTWNPEEDDLPLTFKEVDNYEQEERLQDRQEESGGCGREASSATTCDEDTVREDS